MKKLILLCALILALPVSGQSRTEKALPQLLEIDDKQVQALLTSLRGNVVLVNIWATWCIPCVIEFPHLVKLQKAYEKRGVKVVFISVDELEDAETKVRPFLRRQNVRFPTYIKNIQDVERFINAIGNGWRGTIPTTFVYNRKGKQVATLVGARDFAAFERVIKPLLQ